ncbi:MAG: HAD family hydrolase [Pyrinomonadaceae bacterium]
MFIQGILFDIGDTLLDASELQTRALQEVAALGLAEHWIGDPKAFIQAYKKADHEPEFDDYTDLNHLYSDPRIVIRTLQMLSCPYTSEAIARMVEVYRKYVRSHIHPDQELRQVLNKLREQGLNLGIVSNGTTNEQMEQLTLLDVKEYFDPILISESVGIRKPAPTIFLLAAQEWSIPPDKILVVGDRADWDVLGARWAGMRSALTIEFVDHRDSILPDVKPDIIINSLSNLLTELRTPS